MMGVEVNAIDTWVIFNNTEAAAEPEYTDIRTLTGASIAETGSEDTDERTITSHTYAEPEDTDLKTEVSKLLSKNEALQNVLGDVADRINKYKHRSEGMIGITLLDILTGVIILIITFIFWLLFQLFHYL